MLKHTPFTYKLLRDLFLMCIYVLIFYGFVYNFVSACNSVVVLSEGGLHWRNHTNSFLIKEWVPKTENG